MGGYDFGRGWRLGFVPVLASLALAACGFFEKKTPPPCPTVTVLRDAAELVRFRPGPGRDMTDIVEHAKFAGFGLKCDHRRNRLEVDLTVDIAVERGPASESLEIGVPYFVSVVGPNEQILAKEVFTSQVKFPADRRRIGVREEIEQIIPLQDFQTGAAFEILIGFQLTEDQLRENRRRQ